MVQFGRFFPEEAWFQGSCHMFFHSQAHPTHPDIPSPHPSWSLELRSIDVFQGYLTAGENQAAENAGTHPTLQKTRQRRMKKYTNTSTHKGW